MVLLTGKHWVNPDLVAALAEGANEHGYFTVIHFSGGGTIEIPLSAPMVVSRLTNP